MTTAPDAEQLAPGFTGARRRLQFASRAADLLDRYANQRPDMIRAWSQGRDTDGRSALVPQHHWQARLWRHLRERLGMSWPESLPAPDTRAEPPVLLAGIDRLTLFGLDFLSRTTIDTLRRLAGSRDISVFHLSPIAGLVDEFLSNPIEVDSLRRDVDLATRRRHGLLTAWSRSALESAALLASVTKTATWLPAPDVMSVLASLQTSLLTDHEASAGQASTAMLAQCDGTVQIHRCHGAARQVEVMRDALLHLLAADPTLRPRDVIVLCPDLDRFAPIVEAVMSAPLDERGRHLPVSIIDRSAATATPVAVAVDSILALASGRCSGPEVIDVLSLEVVRRRLDLDDDELTLMGQWVGDLNVRWGLDREHRAEWGYPSDVEEGTWRWAVERLAAGILVQAPDLDEDLPGLAVFDDLTGRHADTVGKLFEFHRLVSELHGMLSSALTLDAWADVLDLLLERLVAVDHSSRGHLLAARDIVAHLRRSAELAPTATFGVVEMRDLLSQRLPAIRRRGQRWADVVRVATPSLFRGVPARVIAVLGFDVDAIKAGGRSADDILTHEPRIGERDARADERSGLLTMLHAARDVLVITCDGHDVNDNSPIPMPVPLEELKDAVAHAIARLPEDGRGTKPLIVDHSRQSADPVNVGLYSGSPQSGANEKNVHRFIDGPWTFDPAVPRVVSLTAQAASSEEAGASLESCVVPPVPENQIRREIGLTALARVITRPTDLFVYDRLGVTLVNEEDIPDWELPLWASALEYANLGRDLLAARTSGLERDDWRRRRDLLGGLPIKATADQLWERVGNDVDGLIHSAGHLLDIPETLQEVRILLPDPDVGRLGGTSLVVDGMIPTRGPVRLSLQFTTWNRRLRVEPWLEIAALTVHDPHTRWTATVVARPPTKAGGPAGFTETFRVRGDEADDRLRHAQRILTFANEVRHRALRSAIPLFERTSWLLDPALSTSATDLKRAWSHDLHRPSVRLVFGTRDLASLRSEPPWTDVDQELPDAPSRADAFAIWLTDTWHETVEMLPGDEAAKGRRSARTSTADPTPSKRSR